MIRHPLRASIAQSGLSTEEQRELISFLERATEEQQREVKEIFELHPAWIRRLYRNMLEKQKILSHPDEETWQRFLADELHEILSQF